MGGSALPAVTALRVGLEHRALSGPPLLVPIRPVIGDSPREDIFTAVCFIHYPEAAAAAETFEIENVPVPTASIDHLIASKRTSRLQDAADIEILEEIHRLRGRASSD